jgi:hypothetical protein
MKYMMFVCSDSEPDTDPAAEPDIHGWVSENDAHGRRLDGNVLAPTSAATTVRVRNGELLVSDGPFTETKEVILGYDLLECVDAAYGGRGTDRRHRAGVPGQRVDDDPPADAGQGEDRGCRHSVPGSGRPGARRAASGGSRRAVSAVHPRLQPGRGAGVADEAIRLARLLDHLLPEQPQVSAALFRRAAALAHSDPERRALLDRAEELSEAD